MQWTLGAFGLFPRLDEPGRAGSRIRSSMFLAGRIRHFWLPFGMRVCSLSLSAHTTSGSILHVLSLPRETPQRTALCKNLPLSMSTRKRGRNAREIITSVQSLSRVRLFVTPWIIACQASRSITNSRSLLKLMFIELVMPSSHLILCCPLLLLPPIPPSVSLFQWVNSWHEVAKVLEFQLQHQSFQRTPRTDLL